MGLNISNPDVDTDDDINDLAALEPADGDVIYWASGGSRYNGTPSKSFGRSLLNAVDMSGLATIMTAATLAAAHALAKAFWGALSIDTYANARLLTSCSARVTYTLRSRTAQGDGGAGTFYFDSSDTTTADNGGTVLVTADGGRLKRVYTGYASSRWFCTGDGVTTLTTPLQYFLALGGRLWLEDGTHITDPLIVPSGTILEGQPTAILRQLTSTGIFIDASNDNVTIRGITVDGNNTADTVAGGHVSGHYGVYVVGSSGTNLNNLKIEDAVIKNFGKSGVFTKFIKTQTIRDNFITRCGYAGVEALSPLDTWISENKVTLIFPGDGSENAYGITATRSGSDRIPQNTHVFGNIIEDVTSWEGIDIHFGRDCSVYNNEITRCAQGIAFEGEATGEAGRNISITGNNIKGWTGATSVKNSRTHYKTGGIVAKGAAVNENGANLNITGNTIDEMGDTRLTASGGAILVTAWDGFTISGNTITNAYRAGIEIASNGTGASTDGVCSGNVINGVTAVSGTSNGIECVDNVSGRAEANTITGVTNEFVQSAGSKQFVYVKSRERLFADRTYYVSTSGSDSNSGLHSTSAFRSIVKALQVAEGLDLNGYTVTIDVGNDTYTGALVAVGFPGPGVIRIDGDVVTPTNVVVSTTAADCFRADNVTGKYELRGMKFQTTTSGNAIAAYGSGVHIAYENVNFGAIGGGDRHIFSADNSIVYASGNSTISGAAGSHAYAILGGQIDIPGRTITFSGTPAITTFAVGIRCGMVNMPSCSFSGTFTGAEYSATELGLVKGNGAAAYFPGTSGGSTATGGQYV